MTAPDNYKALTASMRERLQALGAQLPSLEPGQKWPRVGNKKDEGTKTPKGGNIMDQQQHMQQNPVTITPAGGDVSKQVADSVVGLINKIGKQVDPPQPESVKAVAAKTAIIGTGVIVTAAAVAVVSTVISNRWGNGAQMREFNRLADAGKFQNLPVATVPG